MRLTLPLLNTMIVLTKNKKTENGDKELYITSNKLPMNEIEVANSLTSLASSSTTSVNSLLQNTNNNKNMVLNICLLSLSTINIFP